MTPRRAASTAHSVGDVDVIADIPPSFQAYSVAWLHFSAEARLRGPSGDAYFIAYEGR
jgi:hypothetical protein